MSELNRRRFLGTLAAAIVTSVGVARCTVGGAAPTLARATDPTPSPSPVGPAAPPAAEPAPLLPPPPRAARVALPGGGILDRLPGDGDLLALTVDDGASTDVVRMYTEFARDTGVRLTYFLNGTYASWTDNMDLLRPLVESGQIQLANHTWSHPDLTTVSKSRVADEIRRNHEFILKTYGVDARPYYRPPYGNHDATVRAVAADAGYTETTVWSGSLADSTKITEAYIVEMATKYFMAGNIVLGHLNHLPVTHVYPQLVGLIRDRNLRTVTLDDVYAGPA